MKEYLIKWVGYGNDEHTWEPVENFENAQSILLNWVTTHSNAIVQKVSITIPPSSKKPDASTPVDKINLLFYLPSTKKSSTCGDCNVDFASRNQLFTHLRCVSEYMR